MKTIRQTVRIRDSISKSVRDPVIKFVWVSVGSDDRHHVWNAIWNPIWNSVYESVWFPVKGSVANSVTYSAHRRSNELINENN